MKRLLWTEQDLKDHADFLEHRAPTRVEYVGRYGGKKFSVRNAYGYLIEPPDSPQVERPQPVVLPQEPDPPHRCPECRAYHNHHAPDCSLMPDSYLKEQIKQYYASWFDSQQKAKAVRTRLVEQLQAAQGKIAILRHENNRLRRQLHARRPD